MEKKQMERGEQVEIKLKDYLDKIQEEVTGMFKAYEGKTVTKEMRREVLKKTDGILLKRKATNEFRALVLTNIMKAYPIDKNGEVINMGETETRQEVIPTDTLTEALEADEKNNEIKNS